MNTPPREPTTARRRPSLSAFTVRRDSVGALSSGGKWNDDDNDDPDSPPLAKRYPSFSPQQTVSPKRSSPQKRHKKYGNDNDDDDKANHVPSLTYTTDESDVWRGHTALDHFQRRYVQSILLYIVFESKQKWTNSVQRLCLRLLHG